MLKQGWRASPQSSARRGGEAGFTLIELVLTVAIIGIIAVPLTGVVIEYLKASVTTQTRINESHDQQFAAAYWQQDVASLGVRGFDPLGSPTTPPDPRDPTGQFPVKQSVWTTSPPADVDVPAGCASVPGAVVGFAWNEYPGPADLASSDPTQTWAAKISAAVYSAVQAGHQWQLQRTRCVPGAAAHTIVLSRVLDEPPTVLCDGGSCTGGTPSVVTLQIHARDNSGVTDTGYTVTLTGERRQR